jgi:hypothetical protein
MPLGGNSKAPLRGNSKFQPLNSKEILKRRFAETPLRGNSKFQRLNSKEILKRRCAEIPSSNCKAPRKIQKIKFQDRHSRSWNLIFGF